MNGILIFIAVVAIFMAWQKNWFGLRDMVSKKTADDEAVKDAIEARKDAAPK